MIRLLFCFFLFFPAESQALLLPPIPTVTASIDPNASGWAKITAAGRALADWVCLVGQYQANKWFPLNVRYAGNVSAFGVQIVSGCQPFTSYVYTSYSGYGSWEKQKWGYGDKYTVYSHYENCSAPPLWDMTDTIGGKISAAPFGLGGSWASPLPSDPTLRITGRQYFAEHCDSGCPTFCEAGHTACSVCVWSTLVDSTGSLNINISNTWGQDGNAIYLPYQSNTDTAAICGGNFTALGDSSGATWGTSQGTRDDATVYNSYYSGGGVTLTDSDVNVSTAGIDISTTITGLGLGGGGGGSTVTFNVDLSTTNLLLSSANSHLSDLYNFLAGNIPTDSSVTVQNSLTEFANQISSLPIFSIFQNLVPTSTDTWTPCFNLDGIFASTSPYIHPLPSGQSTLFCLDSISTWSDFVLLIKFAMVLGVFIWGVKYIWGGY